MEIKIIAIIGVLRTCKWQLHIGINEPLDEQINASVSRVQNNVPNGKITNENTFNCMYWCRCLIEMISMTRISNQISRNQKEFARHKHETSLMKKKNVIVHGVSCTKTNPWYKKKSTNKFPEMFYDLFIYLFIWCNLFYFYFFSVWSTLSSASSIFLPVLSRDPHISLAAQMLMEMV